MVAVGVVRSAVVDAYFLVYRRVFFDFHFADRRSKNGFIVVYSGDVDVDFLDFVAAVAV